MPPAMSLIMLAPGISSWTGKGTPADLDPGYCLSPNREFSASLQNSQLGDECYEYQVIELTPIQTLQ